MGFLTPEGGMDDMSDEELQQLIALGIIPDKQGMLDQQIKTAEALRYGSTPEMRGNSRVQTAANPLEFLVAGIEGHRAGKKLDELRKSQEDLLKEQVAGRTNYFKKLRGRQPASQPPGFGPGYGEGESF